MAIAELLGQWLFRFSNSYAVLSLEFNICIIGFGCLNKFTRLSADYNTCGCEVMN